MIVRLSSALRIALVAVAAFFFLAISYLSVRNARASRASGLETGRGYQRAAELEPGNPRNWYLLGRFRQYNIEEPDVPAAIRAYRTALGLDPHSADAWLDLGTAYESEGDTKAARQAFITARHAYPLSAEPAWRYGNFLLRQGELKEAFDEIRQAVVFDPSRGAEAFSRCWRADPNAQAILTNVLPALPQVYVDVIWDLSNAQLPDPALVVWGRLVALQSRIDIHDSFPLVGLLLQSSRWPDALRVWGEAVTLAGVNVPSEPGNLIWDGGFETSVRGGGLAWDIPDLIEGVQFRLDTEERHSGNQSLRLTFDGKSNVSLGGACGSAVVEPRRTYLFSAWVHTRALTTDEGVRFRWQTRSGDGWKVEKTPDTHGSEPWTRVQKVWTADRDTHLIHICVVREPSGLTDNQIAGTAWIDDVTLTPQLPGSIKP